jgi:hypothetical protein
MDVPYFIFEIFEKELYNLQKNLLKKVATNKNLNFEELVKEFLDDTSTLKLVSNTKTRVQIEKKNTEKQSVPSPNKRCLARIWNRGKGGQCTRSRLCDEDDGSIKSDYCSQHIKNRKHGRIDESPSQEIFPKEFKSLYK